MPVERERTPAFKSQNTSGAKRTIDELIDLTGSDDEDYSFKRKKQSRVDSIRNTPAPLSQLPRQAVVIDDEDESDDLLFVGSNARPMEDGPRELYGSWSTKIVGIQYYKGMATNGEVVVLSREPNNIHDPNAIGALNVMGDKIGHLSRAVATKLSPYLDNGSLTIDARLTGNKGPWDIPIVLNMYGPTDHQRMQEISAKMRNDRIPTQVIDSYERQLQQRRQEEFARAAQHASGLQGMSDPFTDLYGNHSLPHRRLEDIIANSGRTLNPREIGEMAEKFGMSEEDMAQLPEAIKPKRVQTELLAYQRQGLAWLKDRENPKLPEVGSPDAVQLWKRLGSGVYQNIATNIKQNRQPVLASGGILADDMGLGKTIQIISLIVSDLENLGDDEPGTTLIIAPTSLLSNWTGQIAQHVNPKKPLRVAVYHGQANKKKLSRPSDYKNYDVVVTTYGTIVQEYDVKTTKDAEDFVRPTGLFSHTWRRVVLDEGHEIRNPSTRKSGACKALKARSRWCLSGTPIVNSLVDLCSLLGFIGITGGLEQLPIFNSVLTNPVKNGNEAATALLQAIMAQFTLRRKKSYGFVNLKLPEITHHVIDVEFSKKEREIHEGFNISARSDFREWLKLRNGNAEERREAGKKYRHLFEVLLRLRQVCNHWKLCQARVTDLMNILAEKRAVELTPENIEALKDMMKLALEGAEECPICYDPITLGKTPTITTCGHIFCNDCITQVISTQQKCPMCRHALSSDLSVVQLTAADMDKEDKLLEGAEEEEEMDEQISSKLKALLEVILSKQDEENPKMVIFSQWTSFLTLIEPHLLAAGLRFTRLDGTMNPAKRDHALKTFDEDPECTILLASLAVASVGLNLVVANTVILSDSWWAPAIEDQAVDRIHRLGQKRECSVFKMVVKDSIEQRVLGIQEGKRKLVRAAFGEGEHGNTQQRRENHIRDLQRLLEA